MKQAIDMVLENEVLNRLLLTFIDYVVNQINPLRAMRPETLAPASTVLWAVVFALVPTNRA